LSSRWTAGPLDGLEQLEVEPLDRGQVDQLLLHLAHLGLAAAVLAGDHAGAELVASRRIGRAGGGRVQLEGPVDDLHLGGVLETGQRRLQPALADVAPRADDVTPDLDAHVG